MIVELHASMEIPAEPYPCHVKITLDGEFDAIVELLRIIGFDYIKAKELKLK